MALLPRAFTEEGTGNLGWETDGHRGSPITIL
jgi:hypothetical protein